MYHIYYNRKTVGDILRIEYESKFSPNRVENKDGLTIFYHNDELLAIYINDFSKIARIFHDGEIIEPHEELLKLINHILINGGLKPLEESK